MSAAGSQRTRGRWAGPVTAVVVGFAIAALTRSQAPEPVANPPGTFSFAVLGDAPYSPLESSRFRQVLRDMEAQDLAFVVHVGDIFWRPCTDELYGRSLAWFNGLRHPVIYTPGDNEWADCWEPGSGSFAPADRLGRIRQVFFEHPRRSLGETPLPLATQADVEGMAEFVENARWTRDGVAFATVHVVGSGNGMDPFPQRTAADDEAVNRRTAAAVAWLRATFAEAATAGALAVVVAFHGNPEFERTAGDPERAPFEPLLAALEEEAIRFARPVLVLHGDRHEYVVDRPLKRRATGELCGNVTRLQVPGSPNVGWVRVTVTPNATAPFAFDKHVVPVWKLW